MYILPSKIRTTIRAICIFPSFINLLFHPIGHIKRCTTAIANSSYCLSTIITINLMIFFFISQNYVTRHFKRLTTTITSYFCIEPPPYAFSFGTTISRMIKSLPLKTVLSVLPLSTTMMSPVHCRALSMASAMLISSFFVRIRTEREGMFARQGKAWARQAGKGCRQPGHGPRAAAATARRSRPGQT